MRILGLFHVTRMALRGGDAWKWAGLFAVVFVVVGIAEEFKYRGYILFTLSAAIGFWPAAALVAALFSYRHFSNVGENWIGLLNAGLAGMVFAGLLRQSGSLWLAIGMHTGWDWAQTYFYGVPDSGLTLPNHLFDSRFTGSQLLTGGAVGPEGSVVCTVVLTLIWLSCSVWLPKACYPSTDAARGVGS
jgi:membrane protease YdiL (CAAX protease family)